MEINNSIIICNNNNEVANVLNYIFNNTDFIWKKSSFFELNEPDRNRRILTFRSFPMSIIVTDEVSWYNGSFDSIEFDNIRNFKRIKPETLIRKEKLKKINKQ